MVKNANDGLGEISDVFIWFWHDGKILIHSESTFGDSFDDLSLKQENLHFFIN